MNNLDYYSILGKPLIMYVGVLTILSLVITALMGYSRVRGGKIGFKWHKTMAYITIGLALIHGWLGLSKYL